MTLSFPRLNHDRLGKLRKYILQFPPLYGKLIKFKEKTNLKKSETIIIITCKESIMHFV